VTDSISGQSRTPPEIKWLLNQRAAVAGSIQRSAQRQASLERKHAKLLNALSAIQRKIAATKAQLLKRQKSLEALDTTLSLVSTRVNPAAAGLVNATAGKYGVRGGLRQFVTETLQAAYPEPVPLMRLLELAKAHFGIVLVTPAEVKAFRSSIRGTLERLRKAGRVEPLHSQTTRVSGVWRWTQSTTLANLAERAAAMQGAGADEARLQPTERAGASLKDSNPAGCEVDAQRAGSPGGRSA
jgi:hypothetical protein